MPDAYHFNPSIVNASHGDFPTRTVFGERMCVLYELEFIYDTSSQGGGVITLDQFVPITDGVLFFRRPGDIVNGITPYSYVCVMFDACTDDAMLDFYAGADVKNHPIDLPLLKRLNDNPARRYDFLDRIPTVMHAVKAEETFHSLFEIEKLANSAIPEQRLLAKAMLIEFLLTLAGPGRSEVYSVWPRAVTEAQRYINHNYASPMTLDQVAAHVALNREYLCRLFARHTGHTIISHLQQVRIYHARLMLLGTDMPVEAVAGACGFQSASHFFKVFKKMTGMPPAEYRRRNPRAGASAQK